MVEAEVAQHQNSLLHGAWVGGGSEGSKCVVVGYALEYDFLAVHLQSEVGTYLYGPDAEAG